MKIIVTKDPMLVDILEQRFPDCVILLSSEISKVIEVFEV